MQSLILEPSAAVAASAALKHVLIEAPRILMAAAAVPRFIHDVHHSTVVQCFRDILCVCLPFKGYCIYVPYSVGRNKTLAFHVNYWNSAG